MNENPGETPNPLNPNMASPEPLDANPSEPAQAQPTRVARAGQTMDFVKPAAQPAPMPSEPMPTQQQGAPVTNTIPSLDPTGRPMQQEPVFVDKPKKKVGLIVAVVIAALALIGGGIAAAVILLTQNKDDAVAAAMNKIMSGKSPANVVVDGNIDIVFNDEASPISQVKIDLNSDMIAGSMINTSTATLVVSTNTGQDFSVEFDEVYAESGDLYFKIDGAMDALENSGLLNLLTSGNTLGGTTTNCVTDENGLTNCVEEPTVVDCQSEDGCATVETRELATCDTDGNCNGVTTVEETCTGTDCIEPRQVLIDEDMAQSFVMLAGVMEIIDGEWLHISTDELSQLTGGTVSGILPESDVSCIVNMVSDINTDSASAAALYRNNPFVAASTDAVTIANKKDPIYKLSINSANFANFINSIQNTTMSDDIYKCLGWSKNVSVTAEDADAMVAELPVIYAEVDNEYNFTRLYVESESTDGNMTVIADLSFTYPDHIDVPEPEEYTDFSDVISQIMSSMFKMNGDNYTVVETETVVNE